MGGDVCVEASPMASAPPLVPEQSTAEACEDKCCGNVNPIWGQVRCRVCSPTNEFRQWRQSIKNTAWTPDVSFSKMRPHANGVELHKERKKRYKHALPPRNQLELFAFQKSEEYRSESRRVTPECRRERSSSWRDSDRKILKSIVNNGPRPLWKATPTGTEVEQSQPSSNDGRKPQVTIRKP